MGRLKYMKYLPMHSAIGCIMVLMGRWNDQDYLAYGTNATTILGQNNEREPDS
jgi:hypothetical protein